MRILLIIMAILLTIACSKEKEVVNLDFSFPYFSRTYNSCKEKLTMYAELSTELVEVDEAGFVISEVNKNPTVDDTKLIASHKDISLFRAELVNPIENTDYYFRPFVKVDDDIIYANRTSSTNISEDDDFVSREMPWTIERLSDFPGVPRGEATSFTGNGFGYMCCGFDGENYLSDFWKYDPQNDNWTKMADYPGEPSAFHTSVVYGDFAYVFFGSSNTSEGGNGEAFKYDIKNGEWFELSHSLGSVGYAGVSFLFNDKIYITNYGELAISLNSVIEFDLTSEDFVLHTVGTGNYPSTQSKRNLALTIENEGYFIFNRFGKGYVHLFKELSNDVFSWEETSSSFMTVDDGLAFGVNGLVYLITGRGLEDDIGVLNLKAGEISTTRFCNQNLEIRRSESVGFLFDNEIIITNGVEYNEDPSVHINPLTSTYKVTVN